MYSRIANYTKILESKIKIPSDIKIKIENNNIHLSNVNGYIIHQLNPNLLFKIENNIIYISTDKNNLKKKNFKKIYALINTTNILFKNYIYGIQNFFEKTLILKGIGYKAEVNKNNLKLYIGFSKIINIIIPTDIKIEINSNTNIIIKGISKEKVGQLAAYIRSKRTPEPYKGNGIRYKNEIIKSKSPKKSK